MKSYAVIENDKVVNVVVADEYFAQEQGLVEITFGAGIGWGYINGIFVDNRFAEAEAIPQSPTKEDLLAQLTVLTQQIQALS
jgi:hypothetical protein